jgi:serine/threonine-protein kinase
MGEVYRAFDTRLHRRVALKLLLVAGAKNDDARKDATARMVREARAAAALDHPNKVGVFELGEVLDVPYIAMEYIAGRTLRAHVGDASVPVARKVAWLCDVARALDAAHAVELIHRDVKPDNVMVREDGVVKVLDFGIARRATQTADALLPTAGPAIPTLTGAGVIVGTAAYMPPEQIRGERLDGRADQFAWAVMAFELVTGQHPWGATSDALGLLGAMLTRPPRALSELAPTAPPTLGEVIARALSPTPEARYARMSEVVAALAPLAALSGPDAPPPAGAAGGSATTSPFAATVQTHPSSVKVATPIESAPTIAAEAASPSQALREAPLASPGVVSAPRLRRYLVLHAAILLTGLGSIVAVGYAGRDRYDVPEWIKMGGVPQLGVIAAFVVGAVGLVLAARRRARTGNAGVGSYWLAILPALVGALGTYAGWRAILEHMGDAQGTNAATHFSAGTFEVDADRFLGFSFTALLFASLAAMPGLAGSTSATGTLSQGVGLRRWETLAATIGLAVVAALAIVLRVPSGALVAGTGAVVLGAGLVLPTVHPESAARDELERATAGLLAVASMTNVGLTRVEAREAVLWVEEPTRASRVAEIIAADREHTATLAVAFVVLGVVLGLELVRVVRLSRLRAVKAPGPAVAALIAIVVLGAIGDIAQHWRFSARGAELRADLCKQFDLFARLDPPQGDALDAKKFAPHKATAVQVAAEVVAVNGKAVLRLGALESSDGMAHLATDLDRALAESAADAQAASDVDLSMSIDRSVHGDALARVLSIARGAGVKRLELLLTRGESPKLPADAPHEVRVVLPRDFVALPVQLADDGAAIDSNATFGELAPGLLASALANAGPVRLAVAIKGASKRAGEVRAPSVASGAAPSAFACALTKRTFASAPDTASCSADTVAWCSPTGAIVACCAKGLVPISDDGACGCAAAEPAPGETRHPSCAPATLPALGYDAIRAAVQARALELDGCYKEGLRRVPGIAGKVSVYFEIDPRGRVFDARIQEATLPDAETQRCMLIIFKSVRFPKAGGSVSVTYPLNLDGK